MMYLIRDPAADAGHGAGAGNAAASPAGPAVGLLLTEPIRGLADFAALTLAAPSMAAAPRVAGAAGLRRQHGRVAPVPALAGLRGARLGARPQSRADRRGA